MLDDGARVRRSIPNAVRYYVVLRDNGECQCIEIECPDHSGQCMSAQDPHIDHVVPHSRGGSDDADNLQVLCAACNSWKKDRLLPSVVAVLDDIKLRTEMTGRQVPRRGDRQKRDFDEYRKELVDRVNYWRLFSIFFEVDIEWDAVTRIRGGQSAMHLYQAYVTRASSLGLEPVSSEDFISELRRKGYKTSRSRGQLIFTDLRIMEEPPVNERLVSCQLFNSYFAHTIAKDD